MKLILGTAQFGLGYGINNKNGKIRKDEAFRILAKAFDSGIDTIDTAYSYGDSEVLIGRFMKTHKKRLNVITKLPRCLPAEVKDMAATSRRRLKVESLYGCLIHNFEQYLEHSETWDILSNLRSSGIIQKIGFSIYRVSDLERINKDGLKADVVQLPFSVLDQRFSPHLSAFKARGIEVHARSVFLQGLVFKRPEALEPYFKRARGKIEKLNSLAQESKMSIASICLGFAANFKGIDKVVIGVDSMRHLDEAVEAAGRPSGFRDIPKRVSSLSIDDEEILLPFNWNKSTS